MPQKIVIKNKDEMAAFAKKIATTTKAGSTIGLKGSLGVGKSFFAREFINALSDSKINVPSPTFNLVYSYQTKKGEVFHFDLYRLKSAQELENIGFFDAIKNGICLIEWPEIAQKFLPKNYIELEILSFDEPEDKGEGKNDGNGDRGGSEDKGESESKDKGKDRNKNKNEDKDKNENEKREVIIRDR